MKYKAVATASFLRQEPTMLLTKEFRQKNFDTFQHEAKLADIYNEIVHIYANANFLWVSKVFQRKDDSTVKGKLITIPVPWNNNFSIWCMLC